MFGDLVFEVCEVSAEFGVEVFWEVADLSWCLYTFFPLGFVEFSCVEDVFFAEVDDALFCEFLCCPVVQVVFVSFLEGTDSESCELDFRVVSVSYDFYALIFELEV